MADRFTVEVNGPISVMDVRIFAYFAGLKRACRPELRSVVDDAAMATVALARSLCALAREHAPEVQEAAVRVAGTLFSHVAQVPGVPASVPPRRGKL